MRKFTKDKLSSDVPLPFETKLKDILERLGVVHSITHDQISLDDSNQATSLRRLLGGGPVVIESNNVIEFVSKTSGVLVMPKFSSAIAVSRQGRKRLSAR